MRPFQVPPGQWQVHLLKSHAVLLQLDPVMSFYGGRHCYIYFHPLTFFKVTARTNARELHFSMTLINASGARSFYYQICFCCLKIFRQKNLRYLVPWQAKGFVAPIAMKMNVQVTLIIEIGRTSCRERVVQEV